MEILVGESVALANRVAPNAVPLPTGTERVLPSNDDCTRVVVNDNVLVSWLSQPMPAPYRGAMMLEHLNDVGFSEAPELLGVDASAGMVCAVVVRHQRGASAGWVWFVELLASELEASGTARSVAEAARLGALAARLHRALATPSPVLPLTVTWGDTELEHGRAKRYCDALATLSGPVADVAQRHADRLAVVVDALEAGSSIDVQPIHGHLHVGQMVRVGGRVLVVGFVGGPTDSDESLRAPRSAMVDLASLVQSIDHVGRLVAERQPHLREGAEGFIDEATRAAVAAYRRDSDVDDALLVELRIVHAMREVLFAHRDLPQGEPLTLAALTALLAEPPAA